MHFSQKTLLYIIPQLARFLKQCYTCSEYIRFRYLKKGTSTSTEYTDEIVRIAHSCMQVSHGQPGRPIHLDIK